MADDRSRARKLRHALEAAGFFAASGLFRALGPDRASDFGGWIGRTFLRRLKLSDRARANLRIAFPDVDDAEVERLLVGMWEELGRVGAEYPHLAGLADAVPARVTVEGEAHIHKALARGRGLIFATGHFANWETIAAAAKTIGMRCVGVQRPTNNPIMARWLTQTRVAAGASGMADKGAAGLRRVYATLRAGGAVTMLVDQATGEGISAPLFGRPAMTTDAPATLALRLGTPILFVRMERLGPARFCAHVSGPVETPRTGDEKADVLALTGELNRRVEDAIRHDPARWLWLHRRWGRG